MTLKDIKDRFIEGLAERYPQREAESLFHIFLEERAGCRRLDYLSKANDLFNEAAWPSLNTDILKLKKGIPYQHVLGTVPFAGLRLKVSPDALIPRPETEELAMRIQRELDGASPASVLDIGTGTGCLALACKSFFPDASVTAIDISEDALDLARINAQRNDLKVQFLAADFLEESQWPAVTFDLIVSNPPYIAQEEAETMDELVLDHDPHLALFVNGNDPLLFYRHTAQFAGRHLSRGGSCYVEINERLGTEVVGLFTEKGLQAELILDAYDKPRFVKAVK